MSDAGCGSAGERARGRFAPVALRLAGLAGWHLGWSPERFWRATPAEMDAVVRAMLGADSPVTGAAPPSREAMARLQEMFPDG
ncbi:MAG: phage tail assembly chaperone [Sphingobium sp.]